MKFGDMPANVILGWIAEQFKFGLVCALNLAVAANYVKCNGAILEEIVEACFTTILDLVRHAYHPEPDTSCLYTLF
ncbi:hypothetical protein SAMN05877838_3985 [Hoeflea halophila]|uniref:Uncharacterized protein n=1 Tax=Hoeflea halophila TaxID=714899 RepID=A0A286IFW5_9HYPH|nr:hypothetical protein [Hoeflea halophila]SOE19035.1 hypothetical protein SAMN05877838_3985 [Hoeflea halophila]